MTIQRSQAAFRMTVILLSVALAVVACFRPVVEFSLAPGSHSLVLGYAFVVIGWLAAPVLWIAIPLWLVAIVLLAMGWLRRAAVASTAASALGCLTFVTFVGTALDALNWWLASLATLTLGSWIAFAGNQRGRKPEKRTQLVSSMRADPR